MERELATRIGGKITVGSGNKMEKGDVRLKRVVRIEAKTTKNKSFSVTLDMIQKIEDAALGADEIPIIVVEFNDNNGKKLREVAVIPTYVLDNLGCTNG
jgi:translation elongation factor EF-Tu-like GTPase